MARYNCKIVVNIQVKYREILLNIYITAAETAYTVK